VSEWRGTKLKKSILKTPEEEDATCRTEGKFRAIFLLKRRMVCQSQACMSTSGNTTLAQYSTCSPAPRARAV
jgi:hypothetical protein